MPNFIYCDIYEMVCCIKKNHNNYFFDEFISENYVDKVCPKIYENLHIEGKRKVNFHFYLYTTTWRCSGSTDTEIPPF